MKTNLLLLFLFGWVGVVFGQQNEIKVNGNYYLDYPNDNMIGNFKVANAQETNADNFNLLKGNKTDVKVVKIEDGNVTFKTTNSDAAATYVLSLDEFKDITEPIYNRIDWRVGIYTVPFKLRFNGFSFDANVNIGTNLGAKIRINREVENGFALEPIFGIGIASIKLDNTNSNTSTGTNVSAFTTNTGVLIHITNSINVGLTYGFDFLSKTDQDNYDWKYNGKGWLGIGINVNFNNQTSNTGTSRKK